LTVATLLLWTIALAYMLAKVEINVEGKHGWAEKLPTWRKKNRLTKLIFGDTPITGYHFWMFSMIFFLYHFPFVMGLTWSFSLELQIIASFLFLLITEDLLWFIINPHFGIKKFKKIHIPWHKNWIGPLPANYILGLITGSILLFSSFSF
jgi:hypothetical protein